jgi:hypothetical protein
VLDKNQFSRVFSVGEEVPSGALPHRKNAAHLKILSIENDLFRYQSVRSASKNRMAYSYLDKIISGFDELDPNSIQNSVNKVLKKAGFKPNYATENYAYSFAKAFHDRTHQASGADERSFWVVSPNVRNNPKDIAAWKKAILKYQAAFMGYDPDDKGHNAIGFNFAKKIQENDIILIARSHRNEPGVVGFGIVKGAFKKRLPGLTTPEKFGSLRELSPFIALDHAPSGIPIKEVLFHPMALRRMNLKRADDKTVCKWMTEQLATEFRTKRVHSTRTGSPIEKPRIIPRQHDREAEYEVRSSQQAKIARRREDELVNEYSDWFEAQGRKLEAIGYGNLQCDAFEESRCNLIEAKYSTARECIRMAAGQLLDYAYLGRVSFPEPNMAILLPEKPRAHSLEWLNKVGISLIWKEKGKFHDNAKGRFI